MASPALHLWLRAETKPLEHRCALTPTHARELLARGFKITVEEDPLRIFAIDEFVSAGCTIAPAHAWTSSAPTDAIILGLKELTPTDAFALSHTHIHFAHCYKRQAGWTHTLDRFKRGGGALLDLEFLVDDLGRRVAAFGYMAGFAGAAIGLDVWCESSDQARTNFPQVEPFPNEDALIAHIKSRLAARGSIPRVLVMGALGRCGRGAVAMLRAAGIPESHLAQWDMAETKAGGPFPAIATDYDVFVNCIYLSSPIPPFLTMAEIARADRKLAVMVDVSCDPTNPLNPVPVYTESTTFAKPTLRVADGFHVVGIDHLPSLLPRESSDMFVQDLLPSLLALDAGLTHPVWKRAVDLFKAKVAEMDKE
ncbi:saccharopine dehydrogenase [Blastocladiella britannica]|nr:saccharopine dehydrogenase [Blastocladiella britannica]